MSHRFRKTPEEIEESRKRWRIAVENAKKVLKRGDRVRGSHGCGPKRTFIFEGWDGNWIVSKSGLCDISPCSIDRLNGVAVDFTQVNQPSES